MMRITYGLWHLILADLSELFVHGDVIVQPIDLFLCPEFVHFVRGIEHVLVGDVELRKLRKKKRYKLCFI